MSTTVHPASTLLSLGRVLATQFKRSSGVTALTSVSLVMPRVVLDAQHIGRYAQICGFSASDSPASVPLTYPQLLSFPLLMHYLTSPDCPWPAMGTVHLANAITQHAPLAAGEAVQVELCTGELRAHEKGQVFTLELRVRQESSGNCVWQATQTLLRTGVRPAVGRPFVAEPDQDDTPLLPHSSFVAPKDIGRRYAPVSGDYNPIHLSPCAARLLGFERAIAHGLWTQARALALLHPEGVFPAATLHTVFKRPLLLPAQATLWQAPEGPRAHLFEVRDTSGQVPHLRSRLVIHCSSSQDLP